MFAFCMVYACRLEAGSIEYATPLWDTVFRGGGYPSNAVQFSSLCLTKVWGFRRYDVTLHALRRFSATG